MESKQFDEIMNLDGKWASKKKLMISCTIGAFVLLFGIGLACKLPALMVFGMVIGCTMIVMISVLDTRHRKQAAAKTEAVRESLLREQAGHIPGFELDPAYPFGWSIQREDVGWIKSDCSFSISETVRAKYRGLPVGIANVWLFHHDDDGTTTYFHGPVIKLTGEPLFQEWIRVINGSWSDFPKTARKDKKYVISTEDDRFWGRYRILGSSAKVAQDFLQRSSVVEAVEKLNRTGPAALCISGGSVVVAQTLRLFLMDGIYSYETYEKTCKTDLEHVVKILDILIDGLGLAPAGQP